ncbi:7-deoxyloganetin glucosyltransferase-like [Herrania umbratica]|uniref:Glycosyltransferase n=1 Tax=Herrania umbratica TaxID=108875 RepID=A0A6J0ZGD1_9ROSI|nr:7-deoxyloganetin glucosyltransferase-like [Herrania umbratica]
MVSIIYLECSLQFTAHYSKMGSFGATKSHAVCVPFPAQGHVNPMMQLAKILHSRGFHITFVNTEFNHGRLIRSRGEEDVKGLPDFRFETIPDGLPPSDRDATQEVPSLCESTRKTCFAPFLELIAKLNSSPELPPVTCIVSDGIMNFGIKAADVLGVPYVQLWTSSTCGFLGYLKYRELIERGIVPFKGTIYIFKIVSLQRSLSLLRYLQLWIECLKIDSHYPCSDENFVSDGTLDMPIDWVPGTSNMRLKDIPSFIRTTNPDDIMLNFAMSVTEECLKSSSIIFNTFDELDEEVLEVIAAKSPDNYAIGPLSLLSRQIPESQCKSLNSSLWKEDARCIEWLNKMEPKSVVYVNYGSVTVMSDHHLQEFAWGLANSKLPFLWIVRPDVVMGESAILPKEFVEEVKDRGIITSWCPQEQVLSHPAVGVFLTHCGWNSMLEAICDGVPLICWPFFAEQQTNCRYACTTWGIGMEINPNVMRDDVEALVKEMMEGDKGKRSRQKAAEWKKKAEAANSIGGSSLGNFDRMIKKALHHG